MSGNWGHGDIKSVIAQVDWNDNEGRLLQVDSRELFEIKEFDLLVIEGNGKLSEDDPLRHRSIENICHSLEAG